MKMGLDSRIFVAGHRGLVGSAIVRRLEDEGYNNLLVATRDELDLRNQAMVQKWFDAYRPEFVFLVAGTVGGIMANSTNPAPFIYDNLMIHANTIHAASENGVKKLLYLGSSCIYPREAPQPMTEGALLTGPLEPTNEWYAIAKISGIKMCQAYRKQYGCDFISAMPTNLYGPNDNFGALSSHVLPGLMRRFHAAKSSGLNQVEVWGTGGVLREFLHVDDLADACIFLIENYSEDAHINIGSGEETSIRTLAETIRDVVHPTAEIIFDTSKPDGSPRKLLDVSRLSSLGWKSRIDLASGIEMTYRWFLEEIASGRSPRGLGD
jgi:GDP-L-fucose synthase